MTFEAFREREGRIAADIVEKLSQKQNIGDIVNQLVDQLTAEFKESLSHLAWAARARRTTGALGSFHWASA